MVLLAEALPVLLIPEQSLIAPMWDYVIHYGRGSDRFLREALHAQGMALEIQLPGCAPAGIITSRSGVSAQRVRRPLLPMFLTVNAVIA